MNITLTVVLSLSVVLIAIAAFMIGRFVNSRLTSLKNEQHAMLVMLNELPKQDSMQEYIFALDQQLRVIKEKLDTQSDMEMMQQYIQDQVNQVIAVVSTYDGDRRATISKEDLENATSTTNKLLERVLWSLRFDEAKFLENRETNKRQSCSIGEMHPERPKKTKAGVPEEQGGIASMQRASGDNDDHGYSEMLSYMKKSGKGGVEALRALEKARVNKGA